MVSSYHDAAIVVDSDIVPVYTKKKTRTQYIFSKADWPKMREEMMAYSDEYLNLHTSRLVNENWEDIKTRIDKIIQDNVPSTTKTSRKRIPWISNELRRKARKKHRLYRKAKKSKDPKHMTQFKNFKKSVQKDIKKAHIRFINEHVVGGLEEGNTK